MYDRRWYDSNENTQRALEILKDMDETQRRALSKDLTTVVKQIKELVVRVHSVKCHLAHKSYSLHHILTFNKNKF